MARSRDSSLRFVLLSYMDLSIQLSEGYRRVYDAMSIDVVKDYVPDSWIALVQVMDVDERCSIENVEN